MQYEEALSYLQSFTDYEKSTAYQYSAVNFDLRRLFALLDRLGNPQRVAKSIHIAGSKGKGSTATMIASVLQEAGFRTGLFTSPHLIDFRERIRVNGEMIDPVDMAELVTAIRSQVDVVHEDPSYGRLTTFELITALAFSYFARQGAEFQVIETGLGGRLDATNVVDPSVCAITSISKDHVAILGDTLEKIAAEKAGIIKEARPVVASPQTPEALAVIRTTCLAKKAPLTLVGEDVKWTTGKREEAGQVFAVETARERYEIWLPLLGSHQRENAATAIGVLEELIASGVKIGVEDIQRGLRHMTWPGRLQVLRRGPFLVVDGAHNADSARRLLVALQENFEYKRLIFVLATSSDKDIAGIVGHLVPVADDVYVTRSQHPRAASTDVLQAHCALLGRKALVIDDAVEAMERALAEAGGDDLVCVTGSLFIVGEALAAYGAVTSGEEVAR